MSAYSSPETGDFDDYFMTTTELIDSQLTFSNLWTWGYNYYGELGDNSRTNKSSPVQTVTGGANWKQVGGGNTHNTAIKTDGTLWTWGEDSYGQLGNNSTASKSSPVQTVAGGTNWSQVSGGFDYSAAIKTDGTLWVWGRDSYGQLGINSTAHKSSPVQTVCGGTNWSQVSGGNTHTSAIKTDGTLWAWGYNGYGGLGDNSLANRSSPVQTVCGGTNWSKISNGRYFTVAIKTDGTLWTWGYGTYGQLGDNTGIGKSSPVQTVCGGTNWSQVSCGFYNTATIKTDGTLWTWGYNASGELGINSTAHKSSPVQTVCGGTNWSQISCGYIHIAAIKTDGTLWVWGSDAYGQLGINSVVSKSSPIQTVTGGTNWKQVSCGSSYTTSLIFLNDF